MGRKRGAGHSPQEVFALAYGHHRAGRLGEAERLYRQVLAAVPGHADSLHLLGLIVKDRGCRHEAAGLIGRAIASKADQPVFYLNLGICMRGLGRLERAVACYRRAIDLRPDYAGAWNNLGNAYFDQGRLEAAAACLKRALVLSPDLAEAWNNLGTAALTAGRLIEAEVRFERALALNPVYAEAYTNAGNALKDQGRLEAAVARYGRALMVRPDFPEAVFNRSLALLRLGQLAAGWEGYRYRWQTPRFAWRSYPQPLWEGGPVPGGRLLVWKEQGIGDEIMAAGLIPELMHRGLGVVLECEPRLVPLFARSFPGVEVVAAVPPGVEVVAPMPPEGAGIMAVPPEGAGITAVPPEGAGIAAHCPGGDLARHLRPAFEDFGRTVSPYLIADSARRDGLRARYRRGATGPGLLVGLAWQTTSPVLGAARSLTLVALFDVLAVPGLTWISLQYGDPERLAAEAAAAGVDLVVDREIDQFTDLDGFAAQIAALDLVVCIDNSTAHLAGALGVPAWVLLPYAADWRWFLEREDSPWYPGLRLFRQRALGAWAPVLRKVRDALAAMPSGSG